MVTVTDCAVRQNSEGEPFVALLLQGDLEYGSDEFIVLYLDRKNGIIGHHLHSTGSDVATVVSQ